MEWFRNEAGDDYRDRMRDVLRAHMEAHRDRPDGTIAEIADPDRYKKLKGAAS
ncbi:MAG: hypothetical protein AB7H90_08625 [Alphaproteobacteria bacterium]